MMTGQKGNSMEYLYGMKLRPAAPGCQPKDFLRIEDGGKKYHNVLVYSRKLTAEEVRDFELVPETYVEFRDRMQKKFNAFPAGAAYSEKQLTEEIQRLGVASKDDLVGIGGGMFIRKTDKEAFKALMDEIDTEQATYYSDEDHWVDMFRTELADHEYCITGDVEDAIEALGFTYKEVQNSERMWEALCQAVDLYLNEDVIV